MKRKSYSRHFRTKRTKRGSIMLLYSGLSPVSFQKVKKVLETPIFSRKSALPDVDANEIEPLKMDHSQKPVLRKKTRKTLTCAAVLCEHSFKGVAQVLYKQVCQSLPATLEQPTA